LPHSTASPAERTLLMSNQDEAAARPETAPVPRSARALPTIRPNSRGQISSRRQRTQVGSTNNAKPLGYAQSVPTLQPRPATRGAQRSPKLAQSSSVNRLSRPTTAQVAAIEPGIHMPGKTVPNRIRSPILKTNRSEVSRVRTPQAGQELTLSNHQKAMQKEHYERRAMKGIMGKLKHEAVSRYGSLRGLFRDIDKDGRASMLQ